MMEEASRTSYNLAEPWKAPAFSKTAGVGSNPMPEWSRMAQLAPAPPKATWLSMNAISNGHRKERPRQPR
jgi:hypothetical protein